jgi:NCS1 family nucleobase:cation symporter-1
MPSVFIGGPQSVYWYWHGFNPRAYAAWMIGVILVVHGVANALKPGTLGPASTNMYNMGFILSSLGGGVSYYLICLVFPVKIMPDHHADEPVTWERMAKTEGFFPDDEGVPAYISFGTETETMPTIVRDREGSEAAGSQSPTEEGEKEYHDVKYGNGKARVQEV